MIPRPRRHYLSECTCPVDEPTRTTRMIAQAGVAVSSAWTVDLRLTSLPLSLRVVLRRAARVVRALRQAGSSVAGGGPGRGSWVGWHRPNRQRVKSRVSVATPRRQALHGFDQRWTFSASAAVRSTNSTTRSLAVAGPRFVARIVGTSSRYAVRTPKSPRATSGSFSRPTGTSLHFWSLRELQRAILAKQVLSRSDVLTRGTAPPRTLGSIAELEPFFEGRTTSRPPPPGPSTPAPHFPAPSPLPPPRRKVDTLRPPLGTGAPPPAGAPHPQSILSAPPYSRPGGSTSQARQPLTATRLRLLLHAGAPPPGRTRSCPDMPDGLRASVPSSLDFYPPPPPSRGGIGSWPSFGSERWGSVGGWWPSRIWPHGQQRLRHNSTRARKRSVTEGERNLADACNFDGAQEELRPEPARPGRARRARPFGRRRAWRLPRPISLGSRCASCSPMRATNCAPRRRSSTSESPARANRPMGRSTLRPMTRLRSARR